MLFLKWILFHFNNSPWKTGRTVWRVNFTNNCDCRSFVLFFFLILVLFFIYDLLRVGIFIVLKKNCFVGSSEISVREKYLSRNWHKKKIIKLCEIIHTTSMRFSLHLSFCPSQRFFLFLLYFFFFSNTCRQNCYVLFFWFILNMWTRYVICKINEI